MSEEKEFHLTGQIWDNYYGHNGDYCLDIDVNEVSGDFYDLIESKGVAKVELIIKVKK